MKKIEFKVTGMHCKSCNSVIEMTLNDLKGVSGVKGNYEKGIVTVTFDETAQNADSLKKAIESEGYKVTGYK
ncbi:MAG: heavy-metal-associated domain-containing protein [archaeon]